MYKTCPKCGYERQPSDTSPNGQCPACGLIFEKWLKQRFRQARQPDRQPPSPSRMSARLLETLSTYEQPQSREASIARLVLLLLLIGWGMHFILMDHRLLEGGLPEINGSFLHGVNLVFHEAGHILFRPFGEFLTVLGGSLGQLIMPAIVIGALLRHGDPFGASVGLWWLGQSLMDLAPYIFDAPHGRMLLLGGVTGRDRPGYHDWTRILGDLGLLDSSQGLAGFVDGVGVLLMLSAFFWGGYVIRRSWR